jgi:hypothetical protein
MKFHGKKFQKKKSNLMKLLLSPSRSQKWTLDSELSNRGDNGPASRWRDFTSLGRPPSEVVLFQQKTASRSDLSNFSRRSSSPSKKSWRTFGGQCGWYQYRYWRYWINIFFRIFPINKNISTFLEIFESKLISCFFLFFWNMI